jgi:hypothetical protein
MVCMLALIIPYLLGEDGVPLEIMDRGVEMDICRQWVPPLVPDSIQWDQALALSLMEVELEVSGEGGVPLPEVTWEVPTMMNSCLLGP